jgi:uncharacterized membrane protein
MGMGLFYVTVFVIFFLRRWRARIGGFALFLRGVLGKGEFSAWCFAGEFVVNCVVIVNGREHVLWRLKHATLLKFIYISVVEKRRGGCVAWESCTKVLNGLRFVERISGL